MGAAWDAFRADPDWIKAKAETEADGPIVSEVISKMLSPTSFSPIKWGQRCALLESLQPCGLQTLDQTQASGNRVTPCPGH